jgi:RNA binding exosome subunit
MEEVRVTKIITSCFINATERTEKVTDALMNLFPEELKEKIKIKKTNLEGHYGNPITILDAEIDDKKLIDLFIKHLSGLLGETEKKELTKEFENHLDDKSNFYIRLDKQIAYMKKICFQQQDPIKIKIKLKKSKRLPKEIVFEYYQRIGLLI